MKVNYFRCSLALGSSLQTKALCFDWYCEKVLCPLFDLFEQKNMKFNSIYELDCYLRSVYLTTFLKFDNGYTCSIVKTFECLSIEELSKYISEVITMAKLKFNLEIKPINQGERSYKLDIDGSTLISSFTESLIKIYDSNKQV
jgi:hypothetical protein